MHLTTAGVLTIVNLANGTLSSVGGVITSSSDARLKENIEDLSGPVIYDFKPKTWTWREKNAKGIAFSAKSRRNGIGTGRVSKTLVPAKEKQVCTGFVAQTTSNCSQRVDSDAGGFKSRLQCDHGPHGARDQGAARARRSAGRLHPGN